MSRYLNYKKSREFLEGMQRPTIVYHKDADGVCSAALLQEMVSGSAAPNDGPGIQLSEGLTESLKDSENVIFLDLPVDQLSVLEELKGKKIFVLDHHPPERNLTDGDILHQNPRFENPEAYLPASYLAYRIVEEEGVKAWKAGVGVVGDHGVEDCKDLLERVKEEDPEIIGNRDYTYEEMKESKLGMIADMIQASKVVGGLDGIKKSQRIIRTVEEPNQVFQTELKDFYETYKEELAKEEDRFEDRAEYFPTTNSYLYGMSSRYSLGSDLSTSISNKKPDAVILVYQKENYGMKISGRCQSGRRDVSNIIKEGVGEYGSGGGHPQAAGGFVESGKEGLVLERFREKLEGVS
ncbi:MAG: DHHA1 domain-containing protein [Candidatus Aenigmatarchaeota archaeon]